MKITKENLQNIIKEEVKKIVLEQHFRKRQRFEQPQRPVEKAGPDDEEAAGGEDDAHGNIVLLVKDSLESIDALSSTVDQVLENQRIMMNRSTTMMQLLRDIQHGNCMPCQTGSADYGPGEGASFED
jgi:hypothetical protein